MGRQNDDIRKRALDAKGRMTAEAFEVLCKCDSIEGTTLACDQSCAGYGICFLPPTPNDPELAMFAAERSHAENAQKLALDAVAAIEDMMQSTGGALIVQDYARLNDVLCRERELRRYLEGVE